MTQTLTSPTAPITYRFNKSEEVDDVLQEIRNASEEAGIKIVPIPSQGSTQIWDVRTADDQPVVLLTAKHTAGTLMVEPQERMDLLKEALEQSISGRAAMAITSEQISSVPERF